MNDVVTTDTDALVIGAGPTGLFQAFQLALLGLSVQIVDALPFVGGQCVALYGDKPIYDIPAVPVCTGQELAERLYRQLDPFASTLSWHLGREVTALQRLDDGRFHAELGDAATALTARCVVVAAGVGAFAPRRLKLPALTALEQRHVFYHPADLSAFVGRRVVVVGGDEAAVQRAVWLAQAQPSTASAMPTPPLVTLLHRRDQFSAEPALLDRLTALRAAGRVAVCTGQITEAHTEAGPPGQPDRLTALSVLTPEGHNTELPLEQLIVCQGLSPRLGPMAQWGLALERKMLVVDPATQVTSLPGCYAVGDICTYPGKKRLILCGFHEATMAAHAAHAQLYPERHGPLLYTSSSTVLQQRLGRTSS